jgi:hypothetical protein
MINVVASNPFNLTPSQILAFGRLCGLTNDSRLPAARLVGDELDRGSTPAQAVDHVRSTHPRLFLKSWTNYWSQDGDPFDSPLRRH